MSEETQIKARLFYTRSLSPLVTRTFAIKWSEDGRLSVVTKEGVHVIEMIPAPGQSNPLFNIHRSFIQSPETLPCERYREDVLSKMFDWDKKDVYSFLMMDAYTPTFPKASKSAAEICDVFWSPRDLLCPHACLLALLTSGGGVELAVQANDSWFSIFDVSDAWTKAIEADYLAIKNIEGLDCQVIRNQLDRLFTTSATWSSLYKSDVFCYAYLVTAHRNSELAVWMVEQVSDVLFDDFLDNEYPNVKLELKFNRKVIIPNLKITDILWIQSQREQDCLIIIGFFNGLVGVLKLQKLDTELEFESYSTCFSEEDLIPVDSLHFLQETEKLFEIVVIKGMHIVILIIDISGKMISMKHIPSLGISITGVSLINPTVMLITSQDGQLYALKKSCDQQEFVCIPVKIEMPTNLVHYLGLASSPNRVMFTLITSPRVMYDHLIDREPSSVFIFSLNDVSLNNSLSIIHDKDKPLYKSWDCLELIKIYVHKYNEIPADITKLDTILQSMTLHDLRTTHWIKTIVRAMHQKNDSREESRFTEAIEQLHVYIFLHSACNYLSLLSKLENMTSLQRLSVSLLRTHLEIWVAEEEEEEDESNDDSQIESLLMQRVKNILQASREPPEPEKCDFCNELVLEPWSQVCPEGHKLPRCAITCLQVTCAKFRSCRVCHEIFHPCLDDEKLITVIKCPYCDLPAVFQNEIIDGDSKPFLKNLSKKKLLSVKDSNVDDKM